MTTTHWALAATLCAASLGAQSTVNEKTFHNATQTDATTRVGNTADTIYFMQPALERTGYGKVAGWRALLQDQDYRTPESVQFGFVKYAATGNLPDVTQAGLIVNGTVRLQFPRPASGNASAAIWTISLQTAVAAPDKLGTRLVLPVPASQSDGCSVHTQRGRTSKVPSALRKAYTYYLTTSGQAAAFWEAGTTIRMGGVYDEPVTQMFVSSTLYTAQPEELRGPEALVPAASDKVGFAFTGRRFPSGVAVLFLSGGIRPKPIAVSFGSLFLSQPFGVIQLAFPLDAKGQAKTTPISVPSKIKVWSQSAFLAKSGLLRLSDATGFEAQ